MTLLITIMFLLMVCAVLLLFDLSPSKMAMEIDHLKPNKKLTLKEMISAARKPKKIRGIRALIFETKEVLRITGKSAQFTYVCIASGIAAIFGGLFAFNWGVYLLIPFLAAAGALLPFLFIIFSKGRLMKDMNLYLETSLSMVTSSYMRTGEITSAVRENLDHLPPPMDKIFREFLEETMYSLNMIKCLEHLKAKVDNTIWREWVDGVINCQRDKALRGALVRVVEKFSEVRYITGELENLLYDPIKEFALLASLLLANIPFVYIVDKDWYGILIHSIPGQIILAAYLVVLLIGTIDVIRLSRPIEYYC